MSSPEQPTFVLLSGASLGDWVWDPVKSHLRGPALVPTLPSRATEAGRRSFTLEQGVAEVHDAIREAGARDVVLVGHSIGGILASGVAHRMPDVVRRVVYLGSYLPPRGKAHLSLAPPPMRLLLGALFRFQRAGVRAPASALRAEYCNDLDEAMAARVVEQATAEPPRLFTDAVPWAPPPPRGVEATYVRLTKDRAVPLAAQERTIAMLPGADVATLDSGHLPMLSHSRELALVLNRE